MKKAVSFNPPPVSRRLIIRLCRIFFNLIYGKKYLQGIWFNSLAGWKYCFMFVINQKLLGYNRHIPFPVHPSTVIGNAAHLHFDADNIDNFWKPGCYYQCWKGHIFIGKGTWIAQNVGIITENHNPYNLNEHLPSKDVRLGKSCWIGMNAILLPGVTLGDSTIVGAGSVVTKSYPEGKCVIAGNPARVIKKL